MYTHNKMDRHLLRHSVRYCLCNVLRNALVTNLTSDKIRYKKTAAYKISPTLKGIQPNKSLGKMDMTG
jgi:hypothetical protein